MAGQVLVGDIGGTNARLALADPDLNLSCRRAYATRDFATAEALLFAFREETGALPAGVCLAIAGPVTDGRGRLTNGVLDFDAGALGRTFGATRIVNDFVAASSGIPHLDAGSLVAVGGGALRKGTKAVIGPGTGLGMGFLIPEAGGYRALPSEGGHGDLATTDPLEHEVYQHLAAEVGFVSWESALSGPGLVNLYRAVCAVWGARPRLDAPEAITGAAEGAEDPVCHQTLEMFCGLLGAAAGNLAVTVCAEGGVYLCGGIVPNIAAFLDGSRFRRRFESRGPMTAYARAIATVVVRSADLGLLGAAAVYWASVGRGGLSSR